MVFSRKPDTVAPVEPAPQLRRFDRGPGVEKQHLHTVATAVDTTQSVIGNDLSIEGHQITIRCKGSLKVLGNIQADLHSRQLEVGKEASIEGAIAAENVDVFGRVNGAIMGTHVVLHAGAEVEGDIHSHLLSIEQGAVFDAARAGSGTPPRSPRSSNARPRARHSPPATRVPSAELRHSRHSRADAQAPSMC